MVNAIAGIGGMAWGNTAEDSLHSVIPEQSQFNYIIGVSLDLKNKRIGFEIAQGREKAIWSKETSKR